MYATRFESRTTTASTTTTPWPVHSLQKKLHKVGPSIPCHDISFRKEISEEKARLLPHEKKKKERKERKGTVPPMKKKRNRRGSAPSSCAPASCPTSSSSRVPRSHRAFPSLPVALRLRLLRRTMSHCPPPCTFVARSREPPRLDRTRSFHHTPLPPLRDNRREE